MTSILQAKLAAKVEEVWELYNSDMAGSKYKAALGEYREMSDAARRAWPDEHCSITDPMQWNFFSDFYKDYNGFRPKGQWTAADVDACIKSMQVRIETDGWPA